MASCFTNRLRIISLSKLNISRGLGARAQRLQNINVRLKSSLANTSKIHVFRIIKWWPMVASCSGIGAALAGYEYTRSMSIKASTVGEQESEEDLGQPNETWTPESCSLFNKLLKELTSDDGEWEKLKGKPPSGERRLFTRAFHEHGKSFEYAFFFCKKKQQLKGVIQFGPYTQGPPGCVHGGAIATMMDAALGVCAHRSGYICVTANLSTNYKKFLPLGATILVESQVDRVEGRKIFLSATMKSSDGQILHSNATALFLMPVGTPQKE